MREYIRMHAPGAQLFLTLVTHRRAAILTLDDHRVTRFVSPPDRFQAEPGTTRHFTVALEPCRLGAGHYYVNFAVLAEETAGSTGRHDLVARFCDFEIIASEHSPSALVMHEARWSTAQERRGA